MPLPADFQFSQASLQDYADCPRRFQLRHIMQLAWPAIEAEPASAFEEQIRLGQAFHRMIHRHLLGIAEPVAAALIPPAPDAGGREEDEGASAADQSQTAEILVEWRRNYLAHPPADLPALRHPEIALSAAIGDHRLVAQYDLVAVEPGRRAVIVDWKTSERRPKSGWLATRLQTRVYRWLLAQAGAHLNGGRPFAAEQITMVYWFANAPEEPEWLPYDATQYAADAAHLAGLIAEIKELADDQFYLTPDVRRCRFCLHRSLCGRGVTAGDLGDADEDQPMEVEEMSAAADWATRFDFEQIAEIAF
ncbi:MAG: PD-(D/E)XK nuclease family protein [Chloroflexi bacterium]|nr:PD-(D/E)XK nuclease family protein [Chloroflexota bacterium]